MVDCKRLLKGLFCVVALGLGSVHAAKLEIKSDLDAFLSYVQKNGMEDRYLSLKAENLIKAVGGALGRPEYETAILEIAAQEKRHSEGVYWLLLQLQRKAQADILAKNPDLKFLDQGATNVNHSYLAGGLGGGLLGLGLSLTTKKLAPFRALFLLLGTTVGTYAGSQTAVRSSNQSHPLAAGMPLMPIQIVRFSPDNNELFDYLSSAEDQQMLSHYYAGYVSGFVPVLVGQVASVGWNKLRKKGVCGAFGAVHEVKKFESRTARYTKKVAKFTATTTASVLFYLKLDAAISEQIAEYASDDLLSSQRKFLAALAKVKPVGKANLGLIELAALDQFYETANEFQAKLSMINLEPTAEMLPQANTESLFAAYFDYLKKEEAGLASSALKARLVADILEKIDPKTTLNGDELALFVIAKLWQLEFPNEKEIIALQNRVRDHVFIGAEMNSLEGISNEG